MKILLLTRWLSADPQNGNMINDLAVELAAQGHELLVLCTEWKGQEKTGNYKVGDISVCWYSQSAPSWLPGPLRTPYKMVVCSHQARVEFKKQFNEFRPDAVLAISFAFSYSGLLLWLKRRYNARLLLILWDFFPYHHFNIRGVNNPIIMRFTTWLESRQLKLFDYIGLMTPRNMDYFRKGYPSVKKPELKIIPIWGPPAEPRVDDKSDLRKAFDLPLEKVIAVFGGTLSKGRGISELLDLARDSAGEIPAVFFIIIGDGPLRPQIEAYIEKHRLTNILCLKRLDRADYQRFVSACDIGIVSTASNMPLIAPFPSKSIDYFRNHLAILASVEPTTDYADILENDIKGGLASEAGDLETFKNNLKQLVEDRELRKAMSENGTRYFEEHLAVAKVAGQITQILSDRSA